MLLPVICPQIPFADKKYLLRNFRVEYLQIAAGDFATPGQPGRGL